MLFADDVTEPEGDEAGLQLEDRHVVEPTGLGQDVDPSRWIASGYSESRISFSS
jgi:hypothetical protein